MDILKASTDWVKSELFSTPFFILFGIVFLSASIGFWQLGKTDLARAYIIPTLVAGTLLTVIGLGLFFTNKSRLVHLPRAYEKDKSAFMEAELSRVEGTLKEYDTVVFIVIPILIGLCGIGIMLLDKPHWRASMITAIAMLVVILLIDGNAYARIDSYHQQLRAVEKPY